MNLPYGRALIWLYLEGRDDHHVKQQLDELSLPCPSSHELNSLREQAEQLPLPPLLMKRLAKKIFHESDFALLERLGYGEAYLKAVGAPQPGLLTNWEETGRILRNPVLRVAIDVSVLCKVPLEEILQMLPGAMQEPLTEAGVRLYLKYFFNHQTMTKSDWKAYLSLCSDVPYVYVRYHAALTKPRKEALHAAGVPSKAAFSEFLKTVLTTAEFKFGFYARQNNPLSEMQARAWAKVGFDAGARYEKFSAGDVTDFSKTLQTSFESEDFDTPTIDPDMLREMKPPEPDEAKNSKAPSPPVLNPDLEP